MTYTKQEKQKLKRVIAVFAERLKESDAFDLVWSDKVGYVLLDISTNYDYVDTARRIDTAEELCRLMLEDVFEQHCGAGCDLAVPRHPAVHPLALHPLSAQTVGAHRDPASLAAVF